MQMLSASPPRQRLLVIVAGVMLVLSACAPAPRVVGPRIDVPFPSPLSGPGLPELDKDQHKLLRDAWKELLAGRLEAASSLAGGAGEIAPARLLQ
jgi:hypothetical protein